MYTLVRLSVAALFEIVVLQALTYFFHAHIYDSIIDLENEVRK